MEDLYGLTRPAVLMPGHTSELLGGAQEKNPDSRASLLETINQ